MSNPRNPEPVKFFLSMIYVEVEAAETCLNALIERLGPPDYSTRELIFTNTFYYREEMGEPLFRRFFSFNRLQDPGFLVELKLFTNSLEQSSAREGRRRVNLDPGYINMHHLILATGKPAGHRPYLGQGLYADLTLIFENGVFRPLPWTYPDYAAPAMLEFLGRVREAYKAELREGKEEERKNRRGAEDAEKE